MLYVCTIIFKELHFARRTCIIHICIYDIHNFYTHKSVILKYKKNNLILTITQYATAEF